MHHCTDPSKEDLATRNEEEHTITADDVEKMRVSVSTAGLSLVAEPIEQKRTPQNVVDAQFSTPFGAAVALVNGAADLNQFTPENIADTTIRELMSRTECFTDPAIDAAYPLQWLAEARIELRDGRTVAPPGTAYAPRVPPRAAFGTGTPSSSAHSVATWRCKRNAHQA